MIEFKCENMQNRTFYIRFVDAATYFSLLSMPVVKMQCMQERECSARSFDYILFVILLFGKHKKKSK